MHKRVSGRSPIRVAIAQASPHYLDLNQTLEKTEALCAEAAAAGARLIVFGETWITGYPTWLDHCPESALWDHAPTKQVFARLRAASITVPGPATERLGEMARRAKAVLVVGANERVDRGPGSGTLYNSLLFFDTDGRLSRHHRKLIPTYTERLIWGPGDATGLEPVDTSIGRMGGLICWEHWMPLARQALHSGGEEIHIAVWPTVHEMHQVASRHYAFEGRCFVVAAGLISRARDLPAQLTVPEKLRAQPDALLQRGGSAIIGPDGSYVAGPVFDAETIVTAEIDLAAIDQERMTLDVSGHYHRPDIFDLQIRRQRP